MKAKLYLIMTVLGWIIISALWVANNNLKADLERAEQNLSAINNQLGSTSDELWQIKTNYASLLSINDSITRELAKKADKHTEQIIYKKSIAVVHDTIRLQDTIPAKLNVDTTLEDKWRRTSLKLRDSTIAIDVSMLSELTLIQQKEKVIPRPRKTWFGRLFQRRVTTHKIYIQEENPYIYTVGSRWYDLE